jgi:hypothetical protein
MKDRVVVYKGSIDILTRVLKTEGFFGWYKVQFSFDLEIPFCYLRLYEIGHEWSNHKGSFISGTTFYEEGYIYKLHNVGICSSKKN